MAIFAVMEATEHQALAAKIRSTYPNDHLRLAPGQWLISDTGNARLVSDKLGLVKGSGFGNTIVFAISSYYGLNSSDVWDWIKTKLEALA